MTLTVFLIVCIVGTIAFWFHFDLPYPVGVQRGKGRRVTTLMGRPHSFFGRPVVTHADGAQMWYRFGSLHRGGDLPAQVKKGEKVWRRKTYICRRHDLPAVVKDDGMMEWWKHGSVDRWNGLPSRIFADGTVEFYRFGRLSDVNSPHETLPVFYGGVEYHVPYWMLEIYTDGDFEHTAQTSEHTASGSTL